MLGYISKHPGSTPILKVKPMSNIVEFPTSPTCLKDRR